MQMSYGQQSLLKEGSKHIQGLYETLIKNIDACKQISAMTRTSLGPFGMKKMVINHLSKILVTSNAAYIIKELEIQHPAAKLLEMASQMQDNECGDQTNFVLAFGGELLSNAEQLIYLGLHPSQIISGYQAALEKSIELLDQYSIEVDINNKEEVTQFLKGSLQSKIYYNSDQLLDLLVQTCFEQTENSKINLDYIQVQKILGDSVQNSVVSKGLVSIRKPCSIRTNVEDVRAVVFSCQFDPQYSETKGTLLFNNAQQMMDYQSTEEELVKKIMQNLNERKINTVIVNAPINDLCQHFLDANDIFVIRLTSKFETQRVSNLLGVSPINNLYPTEEDIGHCQRIFIQNIGADEITVFESDKYRTLILRGSNNNQLDDLERACKKVLYNYRNMLQNNKFLMGAGCIEQKLCNDLQDYSLKLSELDQYAFNKFALSFSIIIRILTENAGLDVNYQMNQMEIKNKEGDFGIDFAGKQIVEFNQIKIYDHLKTKWWAIKLATDAALTVLRIDQIIMAKPAGGPKVPTNGQFD